MSSVWGSTKSSSVGAYGMGTSCAVTRMIGASSHSNACSLIRVADRCLDETLRVPHRCRIDDLQARRVEERRFRILRMERAAANVAAARAAHHHGGRQSGAIARGGDIVREHVVGARDEVDEL